MTQELRNPELLSKEEIEELLPKLADLKDWIKKVEDFALQEAKDGVEFKGFKLVEGRSVAKYKDEHELISRLEKKGYNKALFYKAPELISVTDFKRIVRNDYDEFKDLIDKPAGKLTLVPESDKRPAVVTKYDISDLEEAFNDQKNDKTNDKTDLDDLI